MAANKKKVFLYLGLVENCVVNNQELCILKPPARTEQCPRTPFKIVSLCRKHFVIKNQYGCNSVTVANKKKVFLYLGLAENCVVKDRELCVLKPPARTEQCPRAPFKIANKCKNIFDCKNQYGTVFLINDFFRTKKISEFAEPLFSNQIF